MTEKVGTKGIAKFVILSLIGIFLFLIPVSGATVPIVVFINTIKAFLGPILPILVVISLSVLMFTIFMAKVVKSPKFVEFHKDDKPSKFVFYILAFVFILCILLKVGPASIFQNPDIGGQVMTLAQNVMLTVTIAGWLIIFMLKSGIVEFLGTLLEPLMRPIFKMPGQAAVNCLSAFMVSPAVGVYMSDQYYASGIYTRKEGMTAITNFSTVSVGYISVLAAMAGVEERYGQMVIITLLLVFFMTAVTVRIPPLSLVKNEYISGEEEKPQLVQEGSRFQRALAAAAARSEEFTLKAFVGSLLNALKFSQRIIAYMIPIVVVTLTLVHFTPVFTWLGKPIAPILSLLGMPDAAAIAPGALLGFIEVSLPVIAISGQGVAPQSAFFVVMLAIMQIVFMTEAGNAMLGSSMKVKMSELVLVFIVRTIIAVPVLALISHLLF